MTPNQYLKTLLNFNSLESRWPNLILGSRVNNSGYEKVYCRLNIFMQSSSLMCWEFVVGTIVTFKEEMTRPPCYYEVKRSKSNYGTLKYTKMMLFILISLEHFDCSVSTVWKCLPFHIAIWKTCTGNITCIY